MQTLQQLRSSRPQSFRQLIHTGILRRHIHSLQFDALFVAKLISGLVDLMNDKRISDSELEDARIRLLLLLSALCQIIDIRDFDHWTLKTLSDLLNIAIEE